MGRAAGVARGCVRRVGVTGCVVGALNRAEVGAMNRDDAKQLVWNWVAEHTRLLRAATDALDAVARSLRARAAVHMQLAHELAATAGLHDQDMPPALLAWEYSRSHRTTKREIPIIRRGATYVR